MCREAWDELGTVDESLAEMFKDLKDLFILPRAGAQMIAKVGQISHKYPRCCRPRVRRNIADPYVIAYAKEYGYTVVTDERDHKQKIPVVCRAEGVACISLKELLKHEAEAAA
jgi:Domain of unknown function (DUF4411)